MKPEELSIGDWVNVLNYNWDGSPYIGQIDGIIKKHGTYYLQFGSALFAEIDRCEPIPITPEILEKNGFDKILQQPVFWMYEKYEEVSDGLLYSIKAHETLFRGLYFRIYNHADCELVDFCKQIEFVHELQHALRLCGIDKPLNYE